MTLHQLDDRIQQTKNSELALLNQVGERDQLEHRTKFNTLIFLMTGGVLTLITTLFSYTGSLHDFVSLGLAGATILILSFGYFRGGKVALLSMASVLGLYALHNLIGLYLLTGTINIWFLVVGITQLFFALNMIQQANTFDRLSQINPSNKQLYDDVLNTLRDLQPNNSNHLIELKEFRQTITVWLRPSGVVILLQNERRLYFDIQHTFKLIAETNDSGGDSLGVIATIIDQDRYCLISRHGWLRYTQFAK